ncbi:uncharacterized protein An09g06560 [Aspergillus niger]|uniref:Contig An09c0220, genomic contig n=2 Tax=Aspergillus niger TaxID=5061 RepID=A2QUR9_ASPNC|nr:uncharacterized protein An09g06560 [Aspergillus niger]CAK40449.1 unnamed protein product [Aspergillus niger]
MYVTCKIGLYPGQRSENFKRHGYQRNNCNRTEETQEPNKQMGRPQAGEKRGSHLRTFNSFQGQYAISIGQRGYLMWARSKEEEEEDRAMHSTQERPGAKEADGVGHRQAPKRNADKIFFLVDGTQRWVCDPSGAGLNHRRQPETPDYVGTVLAIGWLKGADQMEVDASYHTSCPYFQALPGQARHVRASGQPRGFNDGSSSASSPTSGPHFLGPEPQQTFSTPSPTYPRSLPCRLNSIVAGIQIFNMHDTAAGEDLADLHGAGVVLRQ